MEQPLGESEWRPQPNYAVDAEVTVLIVNQSAALRGRMFEISVDGCGARLDRAGSMITPASVEVIFKISGMAFRLGGTMRWMDAPPTAGIHRMAWMGMGRNAPEPVNTRSYVKRMLA